MSIHREYALAAILATVVVIGLVPAFAQTSYSDVNPMNTLSSGTESQQILPIIVSTDKDTYDRQSIIQVTGHVQNPITGQTVTLEVSDSNGKIVEVDQLTLDNGGNFKSTINTSSPLWSTGGIYTITAQYGDSQGLRTTTTQITIQGGGAASCTSQQLSATIGSSQYCIDYSITGGTASGATLSAASKDLTVNIQATDDGQITLNIPRSVLDAKAGTNDTTFVVLLDGQEIATDEITDTPSTDARSLTIQFPAGSEKIEIIGTQIVPEFGPIAALVLAIAIVTIIAVSAKTGLRFMPKY